jgi:secondary thiamine-phosphate synthase enzyme
MRVSPTAPAIAFCAHTTCALLINEWEDGALEDFRSHVTRIVPHDGVYYAHDDFEVRTQNMHEDERKNGHAHVKAMLLSATSHAIPVIAGEPGFGRWQRLIFFEMDEPKDRPSRSTCSVPERTETLAVGMVERRKSRQIQLGASPIGGDAPSASSP